MTEGDFLFELARAESAVTPEEVVVSRVELSDVAVLSHPDTGLPSIEVSLDASSSHIAIRFQDSWGVSIDSSVFDREEVAPEHVSLAVRWREIHRDLSLTDLLRNQDPEARLTCLKLDSEAAQAAVSGMFMGQEITVLLPLLDDTYMMWEAMYTFIEQGEQASRRRLG